MYIGVYVYMSWYYIDVRIPLLHICVLILLVVFPDALVCLLSTRKSVCVLILLLRMCPHTTIYMHICVVFPDALVRRPEYTQVSAYYYIRVLIRLQHICPRTTTAYTTRCISRRSPSPSLVYIYIYIYIYTHYKISVLVILLHIPLGVSTTCVSS